MTVKQKTTEKRPLRRLLALFLVCAALLTLFAGCKKSETKSDADSSVPAGTGTASAAPTESADPTAPTETLDPTIDYDGLKTLERYTVEDITADDPRLDQVVARCGGKELTNRQLQIYYYMQLFSYVNQLSQYGYAPAMMGLDLSKPLSEQSCLDVSGLSWEQYFLLLALDQFHQLAAGAVKAEAEGYQMSEDTTKQLQNVKDGLYQESEEGGYESLDAYLETSFGPGVREADYLAYMDLYFCVMSYENEVYNGIEYTDDDLLAFFHAHAEDYPGVTEDQETINVRHILITPEDADGDNTSTDAEWQAAQEKAEALLAEYENDPTEDHFSELANANSVDPGSNTKGGLYEGVYPGQMVDPFNDWCFDASRKTGDTGIVKTTYGYHVMYFVGKTGSFYWKTVAERDYPTARMRTILEEYLDAAELTVDYPLIVVNPLPKALEPATE